jgi:hypothetical protein
MGTTIAEKLYHDYNDYRRRTNHIQRLRAQNKYIPAISKKHLPKFAALANWCQEQSINPRHWLASLFESRKWLFPPKLNQLQSIKHLDRYRTLTISTQYDHKVQQEHESALVVSGNTFDKARDISPGAEMLKARYASMKNYVRCMGDMDTETFGYHPRSEVCQRCPTRFQCASILQSKVKFDILSLRLGLITSQEARMVAQYVHRK